MLRLAREGHTERVWGDYVGATLTNHLEVCSKKEQFRKSCQAKMANVPAEFLGMTWDDLDARNRIVAKAKLKAGEVVRNTGKVWGLPMVEIVLRSGQRATDPGRPGDASSASDASPARSSGDPANIYVPPHVWTPCSSRPAPSGGQSPVRFRLLTFGVQHLVGTFPGSAAAEEIRSTSAPLRHPPPDLAESLLRRP